MQELINSPRRMPAPSGKPTSSHVATTSVLNTGTSTVAYSALAAQRAEELARKDQQEQKTIATVGFIGTVGLFASFMGDLATAGLSKILTVGGLGGPKWEAKVNGVLRSVPRAMRDTEIGNIGDLWHNVDRKRVEFNARAGIDNKGLTQRYENGVAKRAANAAAQTAEEVQSSKIGQSMMSFKPFQWLDDRFRKFANWRHDSNLKQATGHAEGLADKLSTADKERGWVMRKLGKKPISYNLNYTETVETLAGKGAGSIHGATDAKSMERLAKEGIEHVRGMATQVEHAGAANHQHMFQVRAGMRQVANHAGIASSWKAVANSEGSAIMNALKSLPKGMGKASVFHVLAGVGIGVGVLARGLETKRDNRLGDVGLQDLAADVYGVEAQQVTKQMLTGPNAHPLVAEASKINDKTKSGRNTYMAISSIAETANVGTLKSGGMLLLPWYMFGDKAVSGALVRENDTLKAYNMLRQADMGKIRIQPQDRVSMVCYLISAVPGFARNHGIDNRQVRAIAEELVGQGLSTRDLVRTIASPEKMVGMAHQAQAKISAEQEKQASEAPKAQGQHAPATMLAAGKPAKMVAMAEASHEGRIEQRQMAHAH